MKRVTRFVLQSVVRRRTKLGENAIFCRAAFGRSRVEGATYRFGAVVGSVPEAAPANNPAACQLPKFAAGSLPRNEFPVIHRECGRPRAISL